MATTTLIPGIYPEIVKLKPKIGGVNNLGVGIDSNGLEYVLKQGKKVCVAEFIGAAICTSLPVPHCRPVIVSRRNLFNQQEYLFGSAIEPGLLKFNAKIVSEWRGVVAELDNIVMFSTMLAVDLCIGNDDRHQDNWLVKEKNPANGRTLHELVAMDFSNSWPVNHPPHSPTKQPSVNTWMLTRHWEDMGIVFDRQAFHVACAKISALSSAWLQSVLDPMINIWLTDIERDFLCNWWLNHWRPQVIDAIYALETEGEWQ